MRIRELTAWNGDRSGEGAAERHFLILIHQIAVNPSVRSVTARITWQNSMIGEVTKLRVLHFIMKIVHVCRSGLFLDTMGPWISEFQSLFSIRSVHSAFEQVRRKNYVTSIKYNFWCYKPYKVQIHLSVRQF
jgi:hypothetical protein